MEQDERRDSLLVEIGTHRLRARLETGLAPKTSAAFVALLPLKLSLIQARWSGECGWAPLGEKGIRMAPENATCYPRPGQVLAYTGDVSEPELLVPYGAAAFASKAGALAGNHFLTILDADAVLKQIGEALLWRGALPIAFRRDLQAANASA